MLKLTWIIYASILCKFSNEKKKTLHNLKNEIADFKILNTVS